jgi:hypothetical protein
MVTVLTIVNVRVRVPIVTYHHHHDHYLDRSFYGIKKITLLTELNYTS